MEQSVGGDPLHAVELPIIEELGNVKHVFTADELAQCAGGNCCRCGRCCDVFDIAGIPLKVGEPRKPEDIGWNIKWYAFKAAHALCPQYSWNEQGLGTCACHDKKDAPTMRSCAELEPDQNLYDAVRSQAQQKLLTISSVDHAQVILDWQKRGLFSDISLSSSDQAAQVICTLLPFVQTLPIDLLNTLHIHELFLKIEPYSRQKILSKVESQLQPGVFFDLCSYLDQNTQQAG